MIESTRCTGLAAKWCPIHGDCTCPNNNGYYAALDRWDCPLHGAQNDHPDAVVHVGVLDVLAVANGLEG